MHGPDIEGDESVGARLHALMSRLYPICRSITGDGVRETFRILSEIAPIALTEIPSGEEVFDWTIPKEWAIRDAYIKNAAGERVVDFRAHNLHVLNYSAPIEGRFSLEDLQEHLYSLPEQPNAIPYRTSYYSEKWGFCLRHRDREALEPGLYDVKIDSDLFDGALTLGEIVLPGATDDEILISAHTCHPSLANDNLSGLVIAVELARRLAARANRFTYRFVFAPGTIGSIAWLARHESSAHRIKHGLVLTGLGDTGPLLYKKTRLGDRTIDRVAAHALAHSGLENRVIDYYPYGYDERQYNSPGFSLPVGRLSRTPHGEYPEYHTSGDNLEFVTPLAIAQSLRAAETIIDILENDRVYLSTNPKGEPRLGKRGLYRQVAGQAAIQQDELSLLWVLSYADGAHSLLDIAERAGAPFARIKAAADRLRACDLLVEKD